MYFLNEFFWFSVLWIERTIYRKHMGLYITFPKTQSPWRGRWVNTNKIEGSFKRLSGRRGIDKYGPLDQARTAQIKSRKQRTGTQRLPCDLGYTARILWSRDLIQSAHQRTDAPDPPRSKYPREVTVAKSWPQLWHQTAAVHLPPHAKARCHRIFARGGIYRTGLEVTRHPNPIHRSASRGSGRKQWCSYQFLYAAIRRPSSMASRNSTVVENKLQRDHQGWRGHTHHYREEETATGAQEHYHPSPWPIPRPSRRDGAPRNSLQCRPHAATELPGVVRVHGRCSILYLLSIAPCSVSLSGFPKLGVHGRCSISQPGLGGAQGGGKEQAFICPPRTSLINPLPRSARIMENR
jgi:hypothetical protein